eukprot:94678-Prymnesium_polylepis.1
MGRCGDGGAPVGHVEARVGHKWGTGGLECVHVCGWVRRGRCGDMEGGGGALWRGALWRGALWRARTETSTISSAAP